MTFAGLNALHRISRRMTAVWSCTLCLVLCASPPLHADPLKIDLISEVASIRPGEPFYVGLHLKHAEHYHTYWKFPGIVGVPTDMAWALPPGWSSAPIDWPAPQRVMMFQIKAQGFHDEVLLPIKLTPPRDLKPGANITLAGKATWMCCGRDCNPGFTDLSITLPVSDTVPAKSERTQEVFATARANVAQPLKGFTAVAARNGDNVTLTLTRQAPAPLAGGTSPPSSSEGTPASEDLGIFFTEDGYINADKDQRFRWKGDSLIVDLSISTYFTDAAPDELRGIVWLRDGSWGKGALIRAPFKVR